MRKQVLVATVWVLSGCHGAPPIGEHTSPIIGGTVDNGDPAVLLLVIESQQGTMICTGSLIAPDVVLTAGHCVSEGDQYFAFFGTDANQMQGEIVNVTEVHPHPQFNANTLENDIGVAILEQPVPLAPLPINTTPMTAAAAGQATRLVGYGITTGGSQQGGGVKMQVVSKVMMVEPDALFIGAPGKQACEGDSGGPAFMMIGGKEVIVATTSGGDNSCNQGGYHTRVDVHTKFLQPYLGTLPPTPPVPPNGPTPPTPPGTPPPGGEDEDPGDIAPSPPPSAATQAPAKPPVMGGCSMATDGASTVGLFWLVLFAVFVRSRKAAMVLAAALVLGCAPPTPTPAPNNQAPPSGGDNTPKPNKDMGEPMMPPGAEPDPDEDGVFPLTAYTGYDGMHTYQVPLATSLKGTLTWSMSDTTLADVLTVANTKIPMELQQIPGLQWSMLSAKKAGMGKVTATAGAKSASADVVITAYTAAQYTAGQTKYMATCAGCHSGAGGVDHSPTILEFNPDQELLLAITTGAYSDGYKLRAPNHAFTLTEAEKGGIVAYIRSLPPKDFQ